jgi:AcrR family transcriptional regulator
MKRKEQKKKIIDAARLCFARFGYEKTTMEDIGRQVGLNKTSLYHYFKNKDKIFNEVVLKEKTDYFDAIQSKLKRLKGCTEKILTFLEQRLYFFLNVPVLASITVETIQKKQPIFQQLDEFLSKLDAEFLSDIIIECINKGELRECDSLRISQNILTVSDAIKMKAVKNVDVFKITDINFSKINEEIVFTVSLILDGLKK